MIKFLYIKKQKKSILLHNKQQRGFILIELMVVVLILGLITLGLVTFFTGGTKSWVAGQSQLEAQRNARQAMDRMVREIRKGNNISSGSEISVTVDIPPLGGSSAYSVTYALFGTTIQRDSNPLIDDVLKITEEDIFEYYDSVKQYIPNHDDDNINLLNNISKISKIHINLKVDVDKDSNPDITLNSDVSLRNYVLQE